MNGVGRLVRRALPHQRLHSFEARRPFISSAPSSSSSTASFSGHWFGGSGPASSESASRVSNSPFGKCGVLGGGQRRGLKGLCIFKGKSAGRNFQGRITSFHRGGGAKRLVRKIDLKRSTAAMGIVESVEYDPNRSARIALVRWTVDMQAPRQRKSDATEKFTPLRKTLDPTMANIRGVFSFSSLPGMRKVDEQTKKTYARDVFLSSFSSPKANGETIPLPLPRIAIAGANPAFLATQMIEKFGGKDVSSLCEVQKCRPSNSIIWAHRIKRKAALAWQSSRQQETLGLLTHKKTAAEKKTVFHQVKGV